MNVWFASGNVHKKHELSEILAAHGCRCNLIIPSDVNLAFNPIETENSFYGNSLLKARELFSLLEKERPPLISAGDPVIADDSGLCVDALNGRPGIFSARYTGLKPPPMGGVKLESHERNTLLLEELGDNPLRSARFICAMALLFSRDRFFITQESIEGEIVKGNNFAKGSGGFGYDPVFFIPACGKTMAELSETEKNMISHRGKAGKIIAHFLLENSL